MNCLICDKQLKTGKKFCSFECRNKSYEKIVSFKCQQCEGEFSGTTRQMAGKNKFCSQSCVNDWKRVTYRRKRVEHIVVNCNYCEKKIERQPSKVNKKNYCNKSCRGKHVWQEKNLSKKMVSKPCFGIIKGQRTMFRSRWELVFAKDFLEKNNFKWQYESKTFLLKGGSNYTPDFYIEDDDLWVEVKGYDYRDEEKKYNQLRDQYGLNVLFANEYVLKNLYRLNLNPNYLQKMCVA